MNPPIVCFGEGWRPEWPLGSGKRSASICHIGAGHTTGAEMLAMRDSSSAGRALAARTLVTHGDEDKLVLPAVGKHKAAMVRNGKASSYGSIGHAPFWEDAERFNKELAEFVASLQE